MFDLYDNEDENSRLNRIDHVLRLKNNEAFYKPEYKELTKSYFVERYRQGENESKEEYLNRILTKKPEESHSLYEARIKYLKIVMPDLEDWKAFEFLRTSARGYRLKNLLVSVHIIFFSLINVIN